MGMIATEDELTVMRREALDVVSRIDARIRDKLLKRARKQGMSDEGEVVALIEAWKRAARPTKHQRTRKD